MIKKTAEEYLRYTVETTTSPRLDVFVTVQLPQFSRSKVVSLIKSEQIKVNDIVKNKPSERLSVNDVVEVTIKKVIVENSNLKFDTQIPILYLDEDIVVISKPPGISVHHGAGLSNVSTISDYSRNLGWNNQIELEDDGVETTRAGIVHRLDKDTSGVMVIARHDYALAKLSSQFAERKVEKEYRAIIVNTPRGRSVFSNNDSGVIEGALGRDSNNRLKMKIYSLPTSVRTRDSKSFWTIAERYHYGIELIVRPVTGRTHQIRVHCAFNGNPIFGDVLYGYKSDEYQKLIGFKPLRQALHAYKLSFSHPTTEKKLEFIAEIPSDMSELLLRLK
jgi:23S rRNA pseudouridine1911/1915/1917 synthase